MQDDAMRRRAAAALTALGDTAEKVAQALFNGGWLGKPHSSGGCPVALYLTTVLPDVIGVVVGSDEATIHPTDGPDVDVDLTPVVAGFVLSFDVGAFPELIAQDDIAPVPDA